MSVFEKPFDPNEHRSEQVPGEYADEPIIPEGYYQCLLVDAKEGENAEGRPWFLYKWQITAGAGKGVKVSVFENVTHKDGGEKAVQAQRIFRARLANYCDATGLGVVTDPSQLLNRPVKVRFKPWSRTDGTSVNQVTHFRPVNDAEAPLSVKKPFYPQAAAKPSRTQAQAAAEWGQSAADAEDAGSSDYDDDLPF